VSRSGPPGRTADDRAADRDTNTASSEVDAYLLSVRAELARAGKRMGLRGLRRLYTRWESAQTDLDFGGYALAYADPTGEEATERALRAEIRRAA
jgi:hypothetical protein